MAENKSGIIVYADWINVFEELEDIEAGKLIKHFFRYVNDLNPEAPDRLTKIAFEPIKQSLKRDLDKWEAKIGERSLSGRMGNLKRYNQDLYIQVVENKLSIDHAEEIAKSRKLSLSDNSDTKNSLPIANIAVSVTDTVTDISFKKETKDIPPKKEIDFENLRIFWNKTVEGTSIAKINEISEKRKKIVKTLLSVYPREKFIEVLHEAIKSDFLNGNNKNNFSMSFDWFVKKDNFLKVMEGNYKNKSSAPAKIIAMPKAIQKAIELTEEEKTEMRRASGLID